MNLIKIIFLGTEYRGSLQLDELDGIRGLAVLFVLFSHLANAHITLLPFTFSGRGSGRIGVFLFFTLSSFLLTRALIEKGKAKKLNFKAWLIYSFRRITRIYPFYIFVLGFTLMSTQVGWDIFKPMDFSSILSHIFVLEAKEHFWTIATEVKFYLILPVLVAFYFLLHERTIRFSITILFLSIAATILARFIHIEIQHSVSIYFPIFAMGSVFAVFYVDFAKYIKIRWGIILQKYSTIMSYTVFLILILLMPNIVDRITNSIGMGKIPWQDPRLFVFWGVLCSVLIYTVLLSKSSFLKRFLRSAPMRIIGAMSFSLYINHWFVVMWIQHVDIPNIFRFIIFWTITFLISSITYLLIERPLSRIKIERITIKTIRLRRYSFAK